MNQNFESKAQAEQYQAEMTASGYRTLLLTMSSSFHEVRCWKR